MEGLGEASKDHRLLILDDASPILDSAAVDPIGEEVDFNVSVDSNLTPDPE